MSFLETTRAAASKLPPEKGALAGLREQAWAHLDRVGLPTRKTEAWRYTSVRFLDSGSWPVASSPVSVAAEIVDRVRLPHAAAVVVLAGGKLDAELSSIDALPSGVTVRSLRDADAKAGSVVEASADPFVALNGALATDGVFVDVAEGVALEAPVQIVVVPGGEGTQAYPRTLVRAGPGSKLTVVETWAGGDASALVAPVTEGELAAGASLTMHTWSLSGEDRRLGALAVRQAKDSRFEHHAVFLGGAVTRQELRVRHDGEGATTSLWGLYVVGGDRHVDNHTTIDHAVPACTSRQLYKGVLGGKGRGVFDGRVIFREDAQRSDTEQANHNLLLSRTAEIDTKPQLEIFADDVKASHGSTVGQLDEETLFYLRSRGIDRRDAERMLTAAFVSELVDQIAEGPLREHARELVDAALVAVLDEVPA